MKYKCGKSTITKQILNSNTKIYLVPSLNKLNLKQDNRTMKAMKCKKFFDYIRWDPPSDFLHIVWTESETPFGASLFKPKGLKTVIRLTHFCSLSSRLFGDNCRTV